MSERRADICIAAIADAFATDREILASPMGRLPSLGARLARQTTSPQLMISDGVASLTTEAGTLEAHLPYREVFHTLWSTKRHVMMGASQLDAYGNQNISCIGSFEAPKAMLVGARGAPGNTLYHRTSYWIPVQSPRSFCEAVDFVCGVGFDRARSLGARESRYHDLHRVVTNLGVYGFNQEGRLTALTLHPGVDQAAVNQASGFEIDCSKATVSRPPTALEMEWIERFDPEAKRYQEVSE